MTRIPNWRHPGSESRLQSTAARLRYCTLLLATQYRLCVFPCVGIVEKRVGISGFQGLGLECPTLSTCSIQRLSCLGFRDGGLRLSVSGVHDRASVGKDSRSVEPLVSLLLHDLSQLVRNRACITGSECYDEYCNIRQRCLLAQVHTCTFKAQGLGLRAWMSGSP